MSNKGKYGKDNSNFKHGFSTSRIYNIWRSMIDRCDKPYNQNYKNYGARGITVQKEWYDFLTFKKWADDNGYTENMTIDRIDNDKNYEESNCQWITKSENTAKANKHNHRRKAKKGLYFGISPNGQYYEFENANSFAKEHNLHAGSIRAVANGWDNKKSHKKWKFGFVNYKCVSTISKESSEETAPHERPST